MASNFPLLRVRAFFSWCPALTASPLWTWGQYPLMCRLKKSDKKIKINILKMKCVQILSRDSVTVTVDAVIYYRVFNPIMVNNMRENWIMTIEIFHQATNNVEDYRHSTHLLGATTLRNVLGTKCLAEILSERWNILISPFCKASKTWPILIREKIAQWMETSLDDATDPWGVKVERVEM